jgi:hypothetical protein
LEGMMTSLNPACTIALAHSVQGWEVVYSTASSSLVPLRAALVMTFSSAWAVQLYFSGRSCRA